jgi:RNA polymerase sigma-70 factor (ECF subfamily)
MLIRSSRLPLGLTGISTARLSGPGAGSARGEPVSKRESKEALQEDEPGLLSARWFHEHVDALWRLVARLGVPSHSVEDVVQEVFIVASRRQADIGHGHERRFLMATAIRLCSNYRQKAHVRRELSQGDGFEDQASPLPDAEQLLIEKGWRELLERALAQLSETHRTLFVLFELEGFSAPDIAKLLDLPLGTVSSRLWRARAKFSEAAARLQSATQEVP